MSGGGGLSGGAHQSLEEFLAAEEANRPMFAKPVHPELNDFDFDYGDRVAISHRYLAQPGLVGVLDDLESREKLTFRVRLPDETILVIHGRNLSLLSQQEETGPSRTSPVEEVVESGTPGPSAAKGTDASSPGSLQAGAPAVDSATLSTWRGCLLSHLTLAHPSVFVRGIRCSTDPGTNAAHVICLRASSSVLLARHRR